MNTHRFNTCVRIVGKQIQKEELRHGRPYCLHDHPLIFQPYNWKISQDFNKRVKERNPDAMSEFFKDHVHDYGRYLKETSAIPGKLIFYDSLWKTAVDMEHVRHSAPADIVTEALRTMVPHATPDVSILPVYCWFGNYQEYLNPEGLHHIRRLLENHKRQGNLAHVEMLHMEFRSETKRT